MGRPERQRGPHFQLALFGHLCRARAPGLAQVYELLIIINDDVDRRRSWEGKIKINIRHKALWMNEMPWKPVKLDGSKALVEPNKNDLLVSSPLHLAHQHVIYRQSTTCRRTISLSLYVQKLGCVDRSWPAGLAKHWLLITTAKVAIATRGVIMLSAVFFFFLCLFRETDLHCVLGRAD